MRRIALLAAAGALYAGLSAEADDFGALVELQLLQSSPDLFGVETPLIAPVTATGDGTGHRTKDQAEADQIETARGLSARFVTRVAADGIADMVLWPAEAPTHLMVCTGGSRTEIGFTPDRTVKFNPSVQRISLTGGAVTTVLRGLDTCGALTATGWGTLIVAEASEGGGVYEILDPLVLTEAQVLDRESGETSAPGRVAKRDHLPAISWRGIVALDSGVVYGSDAMAPGALGADRDGGAIYKFLPETVLDGGTITTLDGSPLARGLAYALQISCSKDELRFGQGCETGIGGWLEIAAPDARFEAGGFGATGYDRPAGLVRDPNAMGEGVRLCFATRGEPGVREASILCLEDREPGFATGSDGAPANTVRLSRFVDGDAGFNGFASLAVQPLRGNFIIGEETANGDVIACLADGADGNDRSDGCVRVAALKDISAAVRGLVFSPDGTTLYLAAGGSDDADMPGSDSFPTDDILRLTGFRPPEPKE